ncbi:hypothetical protein [Halopseudomonas pertucinogena]|uniref:hypothetical protein n=1 Tax=Halopseudomonas pertucinogena TaxID=86175 RepID=UPI00166DB214|nr:hypothetical protein [Halopseudomonas pertucinogena]
MIIEFSPARSDERLTLTAHEDVVNINGEVFDFSSLPEGATLPREAIGSGWFSGPVERINGELHMTLRLPHGPNPPKHVAFPEPLIVTEDGPVTLPTDEEYQP